MISTSSDRDLGWLAGLIEGEGCFTWKKNRKHFAPSFHVTMTDEDAVVRAHSIAGVGTLHGPYDNGPRNKPRYMWCVQKKADVVGLMMTMYPMMGLRRQAKIREILQNWRDK